MLPEKDDIVLWRFNNVTGYWDYVRTCTKETANEWLILFQSDDPDTMFKLSKRRPGLKP